MTVLEFPPARIVAASVDPVPDGVADLFARRVGVIASMSGFLDRLAYASETMTEMQSLSFAQVIDERQLVAMAVTVRDLLHVDLGTIAPAQ